MNTEIERMLIIAYSEAIKNSKFIDEDGSSSIEKAKKWLETAKWDGTLERKL